MMQQINNTFEIQSFTYKKKKKKPSAYTST